MQQALREDAAVLTALARDSPQAFSQVCVSECRVHAETVRNMFSLSLSLSLSHTHTHTHTHTYAGIPFSTIKSLTLGAVGTRCTIDIRKRQIRPDAVSGRLLTVSLTRR